LAQQKPNTPFLLPGGKQYTLTQADIMQAQQALQPDPNATPNP
jgi:hypothetical protein